MLLFVDWSERNRKVATRRWQAVYEKEKRLIAANSSKCASSKARIISYLVGDGSVSVHYEKRGIIRYEIGFYPDDLGMLNSFLEAFWEVYGVTPKAYKMKKYYSVRINSRAIVEDLS